MSDITQAVVRNLTIANNSIAAAQQAIEALCELFLGAEPGDMTRIVDSGRPTACTHPLNQRDDLTFMGDEAGSRWMCRVCGHRYPEEAAHAE